MFLKNKYFWILFFLILISFGAIKYNLCKVRTMCKVTVNFVLNGVKEESIKIYDYPSNLSLWLKQLKILLMYSFPQKNYITQFGKFKIYFENLDEINQLFDEIFVEKCYFFLTQKDDPFIIDCGSNIGMSILFFKMIYPKAKILGWEPVSKNFDLLDKNVKQNNLKDVTVIQKAVTDKKGKMVLSNPGSIAGTLIGKPSSNYEMVETTVLSEYIDREVDCLKIDIEGGETAVIKELAESKKLGLVKEIILEFHNFSEETSNKLGTILKIFDDFGFKYNINSSTVTRFSPRGFQALMIYAYK